MKYVVSVGGFTAFQKDALEGIIEELIPVMEQSGWEEDPSSFRKISSLKKHDGKTASAAATVALVFGTWLITKYGEKIFDTVYENVLKEPTDRLIKKMLAIVRKSRSDAIEYQSLVYIEELKMSVLVRHIVSSDEDTNDCLGRINSVHRMAYEFIKKHGKKSEIHCYTIVNGSCNIEPELLNDMEEIKFSYELKDKKMVSIKSV